MSYIKEYWREIESGRAVVSKRVYKQYRRLVSDIDTPGRYAFDENRATRPIEFIEGFCKHSKGEWAGLAVKLELFQKAYISALFGFIDNETGYRRYRETYILLRA